jgi:hypothetical protein
MVGRVKGVTYFGMREKEKFGDMKQESKVEVMSHQRLWCIHVTGKYLQRFQNIEPN